MHWKFSKSFPKKKKKFRVKRMYALVTGRTPLTQHFIKMVECPQTLFISIFSYFLSTQTLLHKFSAKSLRIWRESHLISEIKSRYKDFFQVFSSFCNSRVWFEIFEISFILHSSWLGCELGSYLGLRVHAYCAFPLIKSCPFEIGSFCPKFKLLRISWFLHAIDEWNET